MSQQLDATPSYNRHDTLSAPYQHVGTSIFTSGNLIGRRVEYVRDSSGLGRWSWKRFRGRGDTSIHTITFYIPVHPTLGGGPGSVYAQHLTHFYNIRIQECPQIAYDLNTRNRKGYQIILIGDINNYNLRKKSQTSLQN